MKRVLLTAAHSGFSLSRVPLGGGAAICEQLRQAWIRTRPFELEVLGPDLLGPATPREKDLVRYSEREYARFCTVFERQLTRTILKRDPHQTVVLSNDISEGPDFKTLYEQDFPIFTIFHVDVVDYFTTIYLRSKVSAPRTTALYRQIMRLGFSGLVPRLLKLIWDKQEACVRYSKGLIVPSSRMKAVLMACYPDTDPGRIHVLPWGSWENPVEDADVAREKARLQAQFPASPGAWPLFTLSRISPEKGQDRLLQALALWEKEPDFPADGVTVYIVGEAAFMMGKKFEKKLRRLAAKLKRSRIHFVGFAAAARKKAIFQLAELYVFPSRHESYGLTLMEALRQGKPVLSTPSHGAKEVYQSDFGEMIKEGPEAQVPAKLMQALRRLWKDRSGLPERGARAAAWANRQDFSATASRLAELVASQ